MTPFDLDDELFMYYPENENFLEDLGERITAISHITRLRILKVIKDSKRQTDPEIMDIVGISRSLEDREGISLTGPGISNAVKRLEDAGILKSSSERSDRHMRGPNYVTIYEIDEAGLNMLAADINAFASTFARLATDNENSTLSQEDLSNIAVLKVIGGPDNGRVFGLKKDNVRIGRRGNLRPDNNEYDDDLVLSNEYSAVSRVEKPHLTIARKGGKWYAWDDASTVGSFLNTDEMVKSRKYLLKNNDLIRLSLGSKGVELVFIE